MTVSQATAKMIRFSKGNIHDIEHFLKVWAYAKTIGELEALNPHIQYILELAALVHDIACPYCREKYGDANGKLQEKEGPAIVREFFADSGLTEDEVERITFLVGHHHTLEGIDGPDWQILIEADYFVNAAENAYSPETVRHFAEHYIKTAAGKDICCSMFSI